MKKKYPTIGATFETEQRSIKIFEDWIPDDYLIRDNRPDFYIDYNIETSFLGEPTGNHFAVQLKGIAKKRDKKLFYSFKTKHLIYYYKNCKIPVFLFLINNDRKTISWVLAQRYVEQIGGVIELKGAKHRVGFQESEAGTPFEKFKEGLADAIKFTTDLHPGSIKAAVGSRATQLEKLDPRVSVNVDYISGCEQIALKPKQPVAFKTHLTKNGVLKFRNWLNDGASLELAPGEFSFSGMPILEQAIISGRSFLKIDSLSEKFPSYMQISLSGDILRVDGFAWRRRDSFEFEGQLTGAPLLCKCQLWLGDKGSLNSLTFTLDLKKWTGQSVLRLSSFSQVVEFCSSVSKSNLPMGFYIEGNKIFDGELRDPQNETIEEILPQLQWLQKCRNVFSYLNINPSLPAISTVPEDTWNTIELLDYLVTHGSHQQEASTMTFKATLDNPVAEKLVDGKNGPTQIEFLERKFTFGNETIDFGRVVYKWSNVGSKIMKNISSTQSEVLFVGEPGSTLSIELP